VLPAFEKYIWVLSYLGRFGGAVNLQKGVVRASLGRGYAPRPSPRGATANPSHSAVVLLSSRRFKWCTARTAPVLAAQNIASEKQEEYPD